MVVALFFIDFRNGVTYCDFPSSELTIGTTVRGTYSAILLRLSSVEQ